jgi:hypothetical protein
MMPSLMEVPETNGDHVSHRFLVTVHMTGMEPVLQYRDSIEEAQGIIEWMAEDPSVTMIEITDLVPNRRLRAWVPQKSGPVP